jgi:glycosyltransferase involved in cell wall biosynthesis
MFEWPIRLLSKSWEPYSRIFFIPDNPKWALAEDMKKLSQIASSMGIKTVNPKFSKVVDHQVAFYASHFHLLLREKVLPNHRLGMSYLHGFPNTGFYLFDKAYARFIEVHRSLCRIHVSCSQMKEFLINSGVSPEKIFLIPVALDTSIFHPQSNESKALARKALGIPESAVVIGSFQRDGVGWKDGEKPRLEKGPDVLLEALSLLKPRMPEMVVLLSGYARGYVIRGLEQKGIPYKYIVVDKYKKMNMLYHALDLYIVSSRQEGGPKAVFEALASGVPLLTTRVGQAMDIVRHQENAWMVDIEDSEGLAFWAEEILRQSDKLSVIQAGLKTACRYTYESQSELWLEFFKGFVEF